MTIELTPTLNQHVEALEKKLEEISRRLEALHLISDPLLKRIKQCEHVQHFIRQALRTTREAIAAVANVGQPDDDIPF